MSGDENIIRAALDRSATIGSLYDAVRDELLPINIFRRELSEGVVKVMDESKEELDVFYSDKISEKMNHLGIDGELRLSLYAKVLSLTGKADYLTKKRESTHETQCTILHQLRTIKEMINVYDERLKDCVDTTALSQMGATHVIVGIDWGVNTNIVITQRNSTNAKTGGPSATLAVNKNGGSSTETEEENRGGRLLSILRNLVQKEGFPISGGADVSSQNAGTNMEMEYRLKVITNAPGRDQPMPRNVTESFEFLHGTAARMEAAQNTKGSQLRFHLVPTALFEKAFDSNLEFKHVFRKIQESKAKKVERIIDDVDEWKALLLDHVDMVTAHFKILPQSLVDQVRQYKIDCDDEYCQWTEKLGKILCEMRKEEPSEDLAEEFAVHLSDLRRHSKVGKIPEFVKDAQVSSRLELNEFFVSLGVNTDGDFLRVVRRSSGDRDAFVLVYSYNRDKGKEEFEKAVKTFEAVIAEEKEEGSMFMAIDEDVFGEKLKSEGVPTGPRICAIRNKNFRYFDYISELTMRSSQCTAKCTQLDKSAERTQSCVPLELPCPKALNGTCAPQVHEWVCLKCRCVIEYGFESCFYCDCGSGAAQSFHFRCNDPNHGAEPVPYGPTLSVQLQKIPPKEQRTILVIGETGAGKSTWINSIPSYITYENWKDAYEACTELKVLIPTAFTVSEQTSEGIKNIRVAVGKSKNERNGNQQGVSSTKEPQTYVFSHNRVLYRIIDTPGMGDTHGVEQDKKNVQKILSYIARLNEIHLICFLMAPDVTRLTPAFEYCFKELIKQFHRSAAKNIVFCFTKAAANNFQIGETNEHLGKFVEEINTKRQTEIVLNENTEYIFENMPFRYLCAQHRCIHLPNQESVENSFKISQNSTQRLFEYAKSVKPHNPEKTYLLNSARNLVLKLSVTLVPISNAAKETLEEVEQLTAELHKYKNNHEELAKRLKKHVHIVRYRMEHVSQVMCKNCSELEIVQGKDRDKYIEADPTIAKKDPFSIWRGEYLRKNEKGKYQCPTCGIKCPLMNISKNFHRMHKEEVRDDMEIAQEMESNKPLLEKVQEKLDKLDAKKKQVEKEYLEILKGSAKFAVFLKHNAIMTYNDATERYLSSLMHYESKKSSQVTHKYLRYQQMLEEYHEEVRILEESLSVTAHEAKASRKAISPVEVQKLAQHLSQLPIYGSDVRDALLTMQEESRVSETVTYYSPSRCHYTSNKSANCIRTRKSFLRGVKEAIVGAIPAMDETQMTMFHC